MSETSLEKVGSAQLELVRKRIVEMLPGMGKVPAGVQMAVAYVTIAYGLDPFMGDLWPIPQKVKGQIVGYALMFGITARQKMAHRSGEYQGRRLRWLTEQEAAFFDVRLDKGDRAIACEIWRKGIEEAFIGYGIVRKDDTTRMDHGACAILRAERNALKAAFPVELPSTLAAVEEIAIEELDAEVEDVIEGEATEVVYPTREETHTHAKPEVQYDADGLPGIEAAAVFTPLQHWIEDTPTRKKFWAWAGQDLGLSNKEIHQALGVESVKDFPGTKQEAMEVILAWVAHESAIETEPSSAKTDIDIEQLPLAGEIAPQPRSAKQDIEELFGEQED